MNLKLLLPPAALALLALACTPSSDVQRPPIGAPTPVALPTGLTTCNLLGATDGGATCRVYDTQRFNFSDAPPAGAGPDDALARRVFDYERWLDLYNAPKNKFVAGFIGNPPMNFIEALVSKGAKGLRLDIASIDFQ